MAWSVGWHACVLDCDCLPYYADFRDVLLVAVARLPHVRLMAFLSVVFPGYDWLNCANSDFQSCCALHRVIV